MARLPPLILLVSALALPASAAEVTGRVVGFPDGEPLAGVSVRARDPLGASALGTTDSDGAFLIEGVDTGRTRVQAVPPVTLNRIGAYAGDVDQFCAAAVFDLDDTVDVGTIELPVGGEVRVTVLGPDGEPMDGTVRAEGVGALESGRVRDAEPLGDGEFVVRGLPSWSFEGEAEPSAWLVSVQVPGEPTLYAPGTWERSEAALVPALRGESTDVTIQRPEGARLGGQVVDFDSGAPLEAAVSILSRGRVVWEGDTTGGAFLAEDVPGDGFLVRASAPGRPDAWWPEAVAAPRAFEVPAGLEELPAPLEVRPGGALALELSDVEDGVVAVVSLDADDLGTLVRYAQVSAGEALLDGVPLEVTEVVADLPGFAPATVPVTVEEDAVTAVPVPLDPLLRHDVLVTARGGGPVRGARVEAEGVEGVLAVAITDGEGRATLDLPGNAFLSATWEPFCPGDPGLVPTFAGGARRLSDSPPVGEGSSTFVLPPDADRDAMDDVWELLWGLDPARADGGEDPDADGLVNREEYQLGSDPLSVGGAGCSVAARTTSGWWLLGLVVVLIWRRGYRQSSTSGPPGSAAAASSRDLGRGR